jgi:hypothetical protein
MITGQDMLHDSPVIKKAGNFNFQFGLESVVDDNWPCIAVQVRLTFGVEHSRIIPGGQGPSAEFPFYVHESCVDRRLYCNNVYFPD